MTCGGCSGAVTRALDKVEGEYLWKCDINRFAATAAAAGCG